MNVKKRQVFVRIAVLPSSEMTDKYVDSKDKTHAG